MNCLEVTHLSVRYTANAEALHDVSFSVGEGDFLCVVGPNGGGKSTLLKAILSLVPYQGEILLFGGKWDARKGNVGYVPQYGRMSRSFPVSVAEVVAMGMHGPSLHPFVRSDADATRPYLEEVGISKLRSRMVGELSGGEFQRLLIARALAVQPELLLLDEPTASVDPQSRDHIYALLSSLSRRGMTIVMVTHDTHGVRGIARHVLSLDTKVVSYAGIA